MDKRDWQRSSAKQETASREPQRMSRPAPGKVARTSKLSSRRGTAIQRKTPEPAPAATRPQARSLWDFTCDPWMDAAHRGVTAQLNREPAPVQARESMGAETPAAVEGTAPTFHAPGEHGEVAEHPETDGDRGEWSVEAAMPAAQAAAMLEADRKVDQAVASAAGSSIEDAIAAGNQDGAAPDEQIKRKVEMITGADLSGTKVHTGAASQEAALAVNARAFAIGQDIHFATGHYRPGTLDGDRLLAHELTHTVQQSLAGGAELQRKLTISKPGDPAEDEADQVAQMVVRGEPPSDHDRSPNAIATPSVPVQRVGHGLQRNPGAGVASSVIKRALKWLATKGANVSAHIAKRHVANRLGKSTFTNGGKMVKKWVMDTIEHADNVVDQGRRMVFEKAFGHPVGKGGEKIVRVVVDKATGKVVTAFPATAFKTAVVAAVGVAATAKAGEADAEILQRRAVIAKALEPGVIESIIDFIFAPSSVARDEDILAEERIIEGKITEAIQAAEEELKRSLSSAERQEVRERIWLEMATEPTAG